MSDLVTIDTKDGVADVRLNRPDKYNALSQDMFKSIVHAGEVLAADHSVRAVVVSGNGKGFCAGLDFSSFQAMAGGSSDARGGASSEILNPKFEGPGNLAQRVGYQWKTLPVPVIAAIHGVAFGGGFQIALGADIRIARPDARLSVLEIKWGLVPDMGISQTARGVIRLDILKELTFTGRVVQGEEAQALGIITRVSENPLEDALALAGEIATKSPDAIRSGKRLFNEGLDTPPEVSLKLEENLQRGLIGSPNQVESVMAGMEKRAASYTDPD